MVSKFWTGVVLAALVSPAFSAPIISMTDTVGDPNSATVAPGGSFSVNVAVLTDVGTTGISYKVQASTGNIFTLTGRTIAAGSPFDDLTLTDVQVGIPAILNTTTQDLGAGKTNVTVDSPAGTIQIATLTFTLSPSAVGSYTLTTTESAMTDAAFNEYTPVNATYTVAVPEPTSLGALLVSGLLLSRRRR